MSLDKLDAYLHVKHTLTLHMCITCCNREIMFVSLFVLLSREKTHTNEVITSTTNISYYWCSGLQLRVMAQIHCSISELPCRTFVHYSLRPSWL